VIDEATRTDRWQSAVPSRGGEQWRLAIASVWREQADDYPGDCR
jgi:hypothetical protein